MAGFRVIEKETTLHGIYRFYTGHSTPLSLTQCCGDCFGHDVDSGELTRCQTGTLFFHEERLRFPYPECTHEDSSTIPNV
jgi:hypothetical protein